MRVLFLHRYPLSILTGGVAEFLHFLPLDLKKYQVESYLYTQGADDLSGPKLLANGMQAYSGPFVHPGLFVSTKKIGVLATLCLKEKIDLVHSQGLYSYGYTAWQLYKAFRIPYIITSHSDVVPSNSKRIQRPVVRHRCRNILKHAQGVTHLMPLMENYSHAIYNTQNKSRIIGNGIDLSAWLPFHNLKEQNYVLGIGRLEKEKGFSFLISLFARLQQEGVKTSLVIAGSGSCEKDLQQQVKSQGLNLVTGFTDLENIPTNSVIFTGYVGGNLKKKIISQSKCILFTTLPPWEEPFGIVQLEAMAARKALVVSDMTASRYLVNLGMQAILVRAEDMEAWVREVKILLTDDTRREFLAKSNLVCIEQFAWHKVAEQYAAFYQEISAKAKFMQGNL